MTDTSRITPSVAKRRQYVLLAGLAAVTVGAAVLSVFLTHSADTGTSGARPKSTHILSPGAQVDPRDAWRGQADAQLRGIEQKSREITQRSTELENQNKAMLERLRKLEDTRLTAPPPPPVIAPPVRPSFGPDRPAPDPLDPSLTQRLPPPPPPRPVPPSVTSPQAPVSPAMAPSGIVSITVGDGAPAKQAKGGADANTATPVPRDTRRYIPSGSFTRAVLLGGLDAPTGGQVQRNPQPVLLRLTDHAVLPNHFRSHIKACFVIGAGYGDVSSERAYIRTESLSCVTREGAAIDVPIKGYVAGEDGKAGMRGRLVSKQGQILANALLAGIAGGIGSAFRENSTSLSLSPLGSIGSVEPGRQLEAGLGSGVGKALDRLAQYYINLAEKVFPVIEVDAGRTVDVVLTQGVALHASLDSTTGERDEFRALTQRNRPSKKADDDD